MPQSSSSKILNYGKQMILGRWSYANILVTRKCNLRCEYCNVWKKKSRDLELEDWFNEIDVLAKQGCARVGLAGGEPTLREDLPDLIHYISKKGILVSVVSNATLVNDRLVESLVDARLDGFCTSFDSLADFGKHSRKALDVAKMFSERNVKVTLITVMTNRNLNDVLNITSMCDKLGFWHNPIVVQSKDGFLSSRCDELLPSSSEIAHVCKNLIGLKTRGYRVVPSIEYLTRIPDYCDGTKWVCKPFDQVITLNSDGRVMVCQETKPLDATLTDVEDNAEEILGSLTKSFSCDGCLWDCYFTPQTNRRFRFLRDSFFLLRSLNRKRNTDTRHERRLL